MKTQEIAYDLFEPIEVSDINSGKQADGTPWTGITITFKKINDQTYNGRQVKDLTPTIKRPIFKDNPHDADLWLEYSAHVEQYKADRNKPEHLSKLSVIPAYRANKIIKADDQGMPYVFSFIDPKTNKPRIYGKNHPDAGKPMVVTHFTALVIRGGQSLDQLEDAWIRRNHNNLIKVESLKDYVDPAIKTILGSIDAQLNNEELPA